MLIPNSIPMKGRLYFFISFVNVFSFRSLDRNSENMEY